METERQQRKYEELVSLEDYTSLITTLDELAGNTSNGEYIDKAVCKSINCVANGLRQKVRYIVKISKKWRKKQGLISLLKDAREEKRELKKNDDFETLVEENRELRLRLDNLTKTLQLQAPSDINLPSPEVAPKQSLWGKIKAFFRRKKADKSLPQSESVTDSKQPEQKVEVVKEEEEEQCDDEENINEDEVEEDVFEF